MQEQRAYVLYVCQRLMEALKRLPSLYLGDPAVRNVIPIAPGEERWLRETWTSAHERNNTVYGRLDAVCDFTAAGWQDTLHFLEANLSGVGGIYYGPVCEQLVMRDAVPSLLAHDPALRMELPGDQRDLFVQVLIDHSRAVGRKACRLCFVEPKYAEDGINEQSILTSFLAERHGLTITHADPVELRIENGEVYYGDVCVDVAYRDYEVRDLIELEAEEGEPLAAMRLLFQENRVVSSLVGEFDHKSCWEILTDPVLAEKYFSTEECRLFRRHILWTRLVADRKTTLPHNVASDLLPFVRTHREQLVLKPNRSYGGEGVTLGAATEQAEWERLLDTAVAGASDPDSSWVVQTATILPVCEFPVVGPDGRVFGEPFYAVMGFTPTENGLGVVCRASQKQVVNVAQYGGMAAVLVSSAPDELRVPKRSLERSEGPHQALRKQIAELQHLDNAIAVLEWDEETVLPSGGREERGEQLATLEAMRHALVTSDDLGDLIEEVSVQCAGDERWRREVELLRDLRKSEIALPEDLVRRFATARAVSAGAWEEARERNDFRLLAPALKETVALLRETARALDGQADPYDVLIDEYEPGMTRARIEPVLDAMREHLVPLVRESSRSTASWRHSVISAKRCGRANLRRFCRELLTGVGFDFERGHVDRATHPGTTAVGFDDVRVALRRKDEDLSGAILTTMHEAGHALYDQGLSRDDRGTLLCAAPSMGLHEALARLWENHVGRSEAFWRYLLPKMQAALPHAVDGIVAADLYRACNRVAPTLMRSSADELSYHLHIVIRYELEIALISGAIGVEDLPAAWNERSRALLGVSPKSDREGLLQDGHWANGMFGYFPTYTIGSLYAAQLVETYEGSRSLSDDVERGEFSPLLDWLKAKVFALGDRLAAEQVMVKVSGNGLDASAYFRYVEAKYR
jgi:carboxypeptidase Taq